MGFQSHPGSVKPCSASPRKAGAGVSVGVWGLWFGGGGRRRSTLKRACDTGNAFYYQKSFGELPP